MKSSTRFLSIAVLVLLLINIALVIFLVTGKSKPGKRGERGGQFDMIEKEVGMNETQKKSFEALREEHLKKIHAKYDSVSELKSTLFGLKETNANDSIINSYLHRIAELQLEGNRMSYEHFQEVRKLFTGEQQVKYDEFIQKMLKRIRKRD